MPARKIIVPNGYLVDLDRNPPRPAPGCSGSMVFALALLAALLAGGAMLVSTLLGSLFPSNPTQQSTPSPIQINTDVPAMIQPSATVDDWSATGTALFLATITPTIDYCFWLTPTPTPTATLPYTPDAWQATGTAIYHATYPPVYPTPTPDVPMAWCNNMPTHTPTMTALSLNNDTEISVPVQEPTFTPTMTPLRLSSAATVQQSAPVVQQPVNAAPVQQWDIVLPTVGPPLVATATATKKPRKTKTPTPTPTPTLTTTATATIELTPEITPELTLEATPESTDDVEP